MKHKREGRCSSQGEPSDNDRSPAPQEGGLGRESWAAGQFHEG